MIFQSPRNNCILSEIDIMNANIVCEPLKLGSSIKHNIPDISYKRRLYVLARNISNTMNPIVNSSFIFDLYDKILDSEL